MIKFSENNFLLTSTQYGFKKGQSTLTLLEDLCDHLQTKIDENEVALTLFLDLTREFDTIDRDVLICKLEGLGFRGPFTALFKNYFSDRKQTVKIEGKYSELRLTKYGVPQGSSLGPLLFNLYVNDLGMLNLQSKIFRFADDTALVVTDQTLECAAKYLQSDIYKIMSWYEQNCIYVYSSKTKLVCFHNPHKKLDELKPVLLPSKSCKGCSCATLELSVTATYLGLQLDETLSWRFHVESICKKLRYVAARLYEIKSSTSVKKDCFSSPGGFDFKIRNFALRFLF